MLPPDHDSSFSTKARQRWRSLLSGRSQLASSQTARQLAVAPVIHQLLRRREALREVDTVDFAYLLAAPAVEWLLGGGKPGEGCLQVLGLHVDDRYIPGGSVLEPRGLPDDAKPLARGFEFLPALPFNVPSQPAASRRRENC